MYVCHTVDSISYEDLIVELNKLKEYFEFVAGAAILVDEVSICNKEEDKNNRKRLRSIVYENNLFGSNGNFQRINGIKISGKELCRGLINWLTLYEEYKEVIRDNLR